MNVVLLRFISLCIGIFSARKLSLGQGNVFKPVFLFTVGSTSGEGLHPGGSVFGGLPPGGLHPGGLPLWGSASKGRGSASRGHPGGRVCIPECNLVSHLDDPHVKKAQQRKVV